METYELIDPYTQYRAEASEPARLSIALTSGDTGVELVADPSDASVTLSMWGNDSTDELSFDVEDFALVTTLLIRQAQRSL